MADDGRRREIRELSRDWPSCVLDRRQICDLELLLNGAYSPLRGYMGGADFESVCADMRLADGTLWPVPVTLDVPTELAGELNIGDAVALRDQEGVMLAALTVDEVWQPDWEARDAALYGGVGSGASNGVRPTGDLSRAAVAGRLEGMQLPAHYDFRELRLAPHELRRKFVRLGWRRVLAFQTHQTMHAAQRTLALKLAQELGANLLIHPVVGLSGPGDADHFTRVRCYQELLRHFPKDLARLSLLPMAPLGAGPREAVLQAIVHRNHGCTHFTVEPGGGGSILETVGAPAYDAEEARQLVADHSDELGIEMLRRPEMGYLASEKAYVPLDNVPAGERPATMSGAEVRRRLADGAPLPDWFTFPGVERELRRRHPPRRSQGFTVFLTGLSGSGKSTLANALRVNLLELGGRSVALLDGDVVRRNLSSELGFSKEHRDLNILRIGFVAAEITRAGGVAICAPIAPYDSVRRRVRASVEPWGGFILVHVSTPLEVCEERDRKGMYAKARAGLIKEFTGVSDPYEDPLDAEIVIDTSDVTPEEAAREVLLFLESHGYISAVGEG
jgi:sulfate adenylyltransferase